MTTYELFTGTWEMDPLVFLACAAAALAYAAALHFRLSSHDGAASGPKPQPTASASRRAGWMVASIAVVLVALISPIDVLATGYLFSAHMLQHLLLVLIAPPLALLALPPSARLRGRVGAIVEGALRHPRLGWILGVGVMWMWHAPLLCNAAAASRTVHAVQTLSLLAMGTAFWWPILAPCPEDRLPSLVGALYLFAACVGCTVLGILVAFSPVEICAAYMGNADPRGLMPLLRERWGMTCANDQQIGGLLMWVPACLIYAGSILALLSRWYGEEHDSRTARAVVEAAPRS